MQFVRIVESLALALAVLAVILFLLVAGLSSAVSLSWECHGPADDAADEDWAWINGQPVHYQDAGSKAAPTVVLVHGHYVEGMEAWRETLKDLPRSGLRVVAMDSVGYGRSVRDPEADYTLAGQARVLAELLNELRVMDATVVGHDWGCAVALQLAQDQPQFVERLVLVAPVGEHPAASLARCARVPLVGRGIVWAMDANGPLWSARRRAERVGHGRQRPSLVGSSSSRVRRSGSCGCVSRSPRVLFAHRRDRGLPGECGLAWRGARPIRTVGRDGSAGASDLRRRGPSADGCRG